MKTRVLNLPPVPQVNSLGYANPQVLVENQMYRELFQQVVAQYERSLSLVRYAKKKKAVTY